MFENVLSFAKNIKNKSPSYLYHLIPKPSTSYSTRNSKNSSPIKANHSFFKNHFFYPLSQNGTNQIRIFTLLLISNFSEFIRPCPNSTFNVPSSLGLTYLSSLREHKLCHNFPDLLNSIRYCGNAIESTKHYIFYCSNFKKEFLKFPIRAQNTKISPDFLVRKFSAQVPQSFAARPPQTPHQEIS